MHSKSVTACYSYRVKIINPRRKKESVTRELRQYKIKVRIVEELKSLCHKQGEFLLATLILVMLLKNVGYAVRTILQHFILHMRQRNTPVV